MEAPATPAESLTIHGRAVRARRGTAYDRLCRALAIEHPQTMMALADAIGYTRGHVTSVIRGLTTPSRDCLEKLAGAMGVSADALARGLDDVPSDVLDASPAPEPAPAPAPAPELAPRVAPRKPAAPAARKHAKKAKRKR